jgi:hypothetical protein
MSRPRYSIMPVKTGDEVWVYMFRDNDVLNGKPYSGIACHYDGEKRNFTSTLDPVAAIRMCEIFNEQAAEWEKEQRLVSELDAMAYVDKLSSKQTKPSKGFWPFNLFR